MRKTSHDGIDATSITSGIENEIKKAGTNINKIKKSSIKRKVQNFSHESDEGIIEPLLQIEKQKSEIANRSAKYLLNKSKTDSSYERVNKSSDNYALSANIISTSINSTNKLINKDNKSSTSYTSVAAPMHNHMNTNVFGMYDASKGTIATKSPILVEIDASKSGAYSPSPLIFTTAKIHTDSKSKLMEPVQTTPVPILSTIEGNVVKTLANNSEQNIRSFSKKTVDQNVSKDSKSDTIQTSSITGKSLLSSTVNPVTCKEETVNSKGISCINECNNKNLKESQVPLLAKVPASTLYVNQSTSQLSNNTNKTILPTTTISVNFSTKNMTDEICSDTLATIKSNIDSVPITSKSLTEETVSTINCVTLPQKSISTDKNKVSVINNSENKVVKTNLPVSLDLQHGAETKLKDFKSPKGTDSDTKTFISPTSNISPVSNEESEKKNVQGKKLSDFVLNDAVKAPVTSVNKKLQRQKNAPFEEIRDTIVISTPLTIGKSNIIHESDKKSTQKTEKFALSKSDYKNENTSLHDKDMPDIKSNAMIAKLPSTVTTTSQSKPTECIISTTTTKIKSTTDMLNLKPATFSTFVDVNKIQPSKTSTVSTTRDNIKSTSVTTTVKPETKVSNGNTSVMATVSKSDSYNLVPSSTKAELSIKCENSVVTTTLPSYIVSTSKTKIGGTLSTSTLTSTSKSLTQKPFAEVVYTTKGKDNNVKVTEKSDRSPLSMSSSSTKQSSFSQQTKSKTDSFAKDGRA